MKRIEDIEHRQYLYYTHISENEERKGGVVLEMSVKFQNLSSPFLVGVE